MTNINVTGKDVLQDGTPVGFSVVAKGEFATMFGKLYGVPTMKVGATSQATAGVTTKLEIALVLDTTYSMTGAKITAAKDAAKELIAKLSAKAKTPDQIRFALIPYAQYVRIDTTLRTSGMVDVPDDYTEVKNVCYITRPVVSQTNCVTETRTGYRDGVPYTYNYTTCDYVYGDPETVCNDFTYNYKWYGCVGSRSYPYNTMDGDYTNNRLPGIVNLSTTCGGSVIVPLTSDTTVLNTAIDSMGVNGETYMPSGLVWGGVC